MQHDMETRKKKKHQPQDMDQDDQDENMAPLQYSSLHVKTKSLSADDLVYIDIDMYRSMYRYQAIHVCIFDR